ncbi:Protein smoothened [Pseudolycoriella hygida]|uniref:Protein smoothened n=1 Tax=Pseudolycoriella hygida TaxID=35572 RepID=A0A9Q0NBD6_9DIPT|nr:Protein smoothened [Pseudolycoriella hygida]
MILPAIALKLSVILLILHLSCCFQNTVKRSVSDFGQRGSRLPGSNDDDIPDIEPIVGSQNYRINGKKGKDDKPWFDGRDIRHIHCVRPGKCEKLKNSTCFGSKLPYQFTSLDLTDSLSQDESRERLYNYEALRNIPKCWAVIQPFLCAVYVPKCENIGNRDLVYLPSLEMCRITLEPCRILYNTTFFPEFLKCNETLFPSKCNNDVREMKFNATGNCLLPLVPTDSSTSYYKDIEGCGIQCKDPLYTDDEHRQINKLNAWGASLCLVCNLFSIITFLIDWQNANKYPALIIFYINFCFLINCLGWLAQFTPGSREDIVCRKDGTLRHSEPSAGENLSCIVVFVLVFYSQISVMVWFVIFAYSFHLRAVGNAQDRIDKKGSYFHLVAWSFPLVLTITIMALSEVDGNSIVGICFVGYVNHPMRAGFILGPLCGVLLVGGFFIIRGMIMLFDLKNFATGIKSLTVSNKIHLTIVRIGLTTMFAFVFILVAVICQIYEFRNSHLWTAGLRELIICKILSTYTDVHTACKLENRPSVAILQLQLLCLFGSGIVMSSLCWTTSSIDTWKRYIKKKLGYETGNEEIKIRKHKVIAQTWAKRKEFQDKGRLSISFYKSHTDPVGLNFNVNDLNSTATNDISTTWTNYLPGLLRRRFALTGATTNSSSCASRKSSLDSEISVSVRHYSVESRRNSVDSQVSVKIAEVQTKVARRTHGTVKSKTRGRRRDFNATSKRFRRESSTSVESQIVTALKKTSYPSNAFFTSKDKSLKRRNAGIVDTNDITNFLNSVLHNDGISATSDDDNVSRTSVKIQDSRLDFVMRQDMRLSDDEFGGRPKYARSDDDLERNTYPMLQDVIKPANVTSTNNSLKSSKERPDGDRNSKTSLRSMKSRKSSRPNSRRLKKNSKNVTKAPTKKDAAGQFSGLDDSSFASYSSDLEIPTGVQSSYSGVSVAKTHSRNSKTSCDVGTQANSYEIETQTQLTDEYETTERRNESNDKEDDEFTENNQLLTPNKRKESAICSRRDTLSMSENDKLKMLLLPSK